MKVINVLPPAIYNRLAAGEVVENPASIVKELLENSLDANAQHITIQISNGGIDEIVIIDDGEGVAEKELPKVFMPHATSKIKSAEDIDRIQSLGFRGEALASIASVAKVSFTSKPAGQDYAVQINQDNEQQYTGGNNGTTVRVSNLFYNTPARKKFLRSPNVEKNHVTQIVHEIIFANPNRHFRYYVDQQLILDYRGQGLAAAMELIYNIDGTQLISLQNEGQGISVDGYISNLNLSKINKDRQVIIINGRVVNCGLIGTTINETMSNYLPAKEYPVFVLHFNVAVDCVDVNVHPQKREVRFEKRDDIIEFVRQSVTKAMESFFLNQISALTEPTQQGNTFSHKSAETTHMATEISDSSNDKIQTAGYSFNPDKIESSNVLIQSLDNLSENIDKLKSAPNILNNINIIEPLSGTQTSSFSENCFTVLGQVFDTYLLVRTNDSLIVVDQHAMAERMNYDRFRAEIDQSSVQSQGLLTPLVISVTPKEMIRFVELKSMLQAFGFDCDEFGEDSVRISAVPSIMVNASLKDFIKVILNDKTVVSDNISELVKHRVATAACKASIKAGDVLSSVQIETFMNHYFETKNVPLCPHGRPIMLVFNRNKLETLFARK